MSGSRCARLFAKTGLHHQAVRRSLHGDRDVSAFELLKWAEVLGMSLTVKHGEQPASTMGKQMSIRSLFGSSAVAERLSSPCR